MPFAKGKFSNTVFEGNVSDSDTFLEGAVRGGTIRNNVIRGGTVTVNTSARHKRLSLGSFIRDSGDMGILAFAVFLGAVVVIVGSFLTSAWVLMLLMGALHHSVSDLVPAIGYWMSLIIVTALAFLKGLIR